MIRTDTDLSVTVLRAVTATHTRCPAVGRGRVSAGPVTMLYSSATRHGTRFPRTPGRP